MTLPPNADVGRFLISCEDKPGIVAGVSKFIYEREGNVLNSDQHTTDPFGGAFFMRMEFHLPGLADQYADVCDEFRRTVAEPLRLEWDLALAAKTRRVAILCSRNDHCVLDLLWRARRGELGGTVELVVSNHPDLRGDVEALGVRFEHIPVAANHKIDAEEAMLSRLAGRFDLVVLARYMQILSGDFLKRVHAPLINIHHSFLPAFAGAGPYERAARKGVKIIGATAHYVTEELDEGPIIEQDVARVTHRENAMTLARVGADVERIVLARAVKWHLNDQVIVHENRTVVF